MTEKQKMAFERIKRSDKDPLYPADVAGVLGCGQYSLTIQARNDPDGLGFPVRRIGTRTQIPRFAFLEYCRKVMGFE